MNKKRFLQQNHPEKKILDDFSELDIEFHQSESIEYYSSKGDLDMETNFENQMSLTDRIVLQEGQIPKQNVRVLYQWHPEPKTIEDTDYLTASMHESCFIDPYELQRMEEARLIEEERLRKEQERRDQLKMMMDDEWKKAEEMWGAREQKITAEQQARIRELPTVTEKMESMGIREYVIIPLHEHKLQRIMPRLPDKYPVRIETCDIWQCNDFDQNEVKCKSGLQASYQRIGVIRYQCIEDQCEFTICSYCLLRNVEENMELFKMLQDQEELKNKQENPEDSQESSTIDDGEKRIRIPQHKHALTRIEPFPQNFGYWLCNGVDMIQGGCKSGYEDVGDAKDAPYYTCSKNKCDLDLCDKCVQFLLNDK